MIQRESLSVFTDNEMIDLIQAKYNDIGIDVKENILSKFKEYCNSKCKNRIVDLTENYCFLTQISFYWKNFQFLVVIFYSCLNLYLFY